MLTTTRRKFLASISAAASATAAGFVSLASRAPGFLFESAAIGAQQPRGEKVLVVLQLSGGNDGLNTVVPYADENYRRRRPSLALEAGSVIKLEAGIGLHPSLRGLATLLEKQWLAVVQGVGYPNPNRSHFESMDIWHTAQTRPIEPKLGWLGRALDLHRAAASWDGSPTRPGSSPGSGSPTRALASADLAALHLGEEAQPVALAARNVASPSLRSLAQFRLDSGGNDRQRDTIAALAAAPRPAAGDLLQFVQTRTTSALEISRRLAAASEKYHTSINYPGTPLGQKLKQIAQLIDAGLAARVYYVILDGFDTHSEQAAAHAGLLNQLGGALAAFAEDLQIHGQLDRVVTLVFSEFGRRLEENASRGTDHGAAAPVFLVGSRVKSGLVGTHPSLTDLQDGDVKFHTDFRTVYAALLEHWLG